MWVCYMGEISDSYLENWTPHIVQPDQSSPSIFDVLKEGCSWEIGYRLSQTVAEKCFSDRIQVDWGGWAYKVNKDSILTYNEMVSPDDRISVQGLESDKQYAIIDVECY